MGTFDSSGQGRTGDGEESGSRKSPGGQGTKNRSGWAVERTSGLKGGRGGQYESIRFHYLYLARKRTTIKKKTWEKSKEDLDSLQKEKGRGACSLGAFRSPHRQERCEVSTQFH